MKMESVCYFPFPKLGLFKYLVVDVMMHVDHLDACKFMHIINKDGRKFIFKNYIAVRNGFVNDGLIDLVFDYGL